MNNFYKQFSQNTDSFRELPVNDVIGRLSLEIKKLKDFSGDKLLFVGSENPTILFIVAQPGDSEIKSGVPFSDKVHSKVFGFVEYLTKTYKPLPFYCTYFKPKKDATRAACYSKLSLELKTLKPLLVVVVGRGLEADMLKEKLSLKSSDEGQTYLVNGGYYPYFCIKTELPELTYSRDVVVYSVKKDLDSIIELLKVNEPK